MKTNLLLLKTIFTGLVFMIFSFNHAQTGCENAIEITGDLTNEPLVCGTEDLLNAASVGGLCEDANSGGSMPDAYGDGLEATYTYTSTENETVTVTVSDADFISIFIYDGCPTGDGECVTATRSGSDTRTVIFNATAGVEYFIWIDNWPSPDSPCTAGGLLSFSAVPDDGGHIYCIPSGGSNDFTGITNVTFNSIDNDSGTSDTVFFEDFTDISTTVQPGASYDLSVSVNSGGEEGLVNAKAWIDWNDDGIFDVVDEAYDLGSAFNTEDGLTSLSPVSVSIPSDVAAGEYRMRIRAVNNFYDEPDPCATQSWSEAEDYTIIVSDEIQEGCLWTVIVENPGYYGDEVHWELRDSDGEILLFGGEYNSEGFYDEQQIFNEGPVEFYISAIGEYNDNFPAYSVANENGIIVFGILPPGTEQTYSDLECSDNPPPPSTYLCDNQFVIYEGFESSYIMNDFNAKLAVDIRGSDSGFTLYGMKVTLLSTIDDPWIDFTFYDDDNGKPGEVIGGTGGEIIEAELIEPLFEGLSAYNFSVLFDDSQEIGPNEIIWAEVNGEVDSWSLITLTTVGYGLAINSDFSNNEWVIDPTSEFIYELICQPLSVDEFKIADFSFYPNPVKDILNINSATPIQSVSIINLTGQKVMDLQSDKIQKEQVDMSSLTPGVYVFRVVLENGQVETFKVVKK